MRTSLIEMQQIERFLGGRLSPEEQADWKVRIATEPQLAERIAEQQYALRLVCEYGREQVRAEIARVDEAMFTRRRHRPFRYGILSLFQRK